MAKSDEIRARLVEGKARFHANDNISQYLREGDLGELEKELTGRFEAVLDSLLIDRSNDPNSKETGHRMAKMYLHELMRGRYYGSPKITAFPNEKLEFAGGDDVRPAYSYNGLLVVPAEITSVCSHHHAIVTGIMYIGIVPGEHVIGLSKYIRLAQHLARRGTLQEQLTVDVLHAVQKAAKTPDVAVVNYSTHGCCTNRGVEAHNAYTGSAELGGLFALSSDTRKEFYEHVAALEARRNK